MAIAPSRLRATREGRCRVKRGDSRRRLAAGPSLELRSDVLIRPTARANPHVERVRRKIGAVGPHDSPRLTINRDLGKALGVARVLEDRPPHAVEDVNLALEA